MQTFTGGNMRKARFKAFYAAIGRFVLSWADLEIGLDLLVLIMRSMEEDHHDKKLPHNLEPKIAFVRCRADKLKSLNAQRSDIIKILDEIASLADTRHAFVHGAVIKSYVERSAISATITRLLQPKNRPRRKPVKVTTAEINKISNSVRALSERLLDMAEAINAYSK